MVEAIKQRVVLLADDDVMIRNCVRRSLEAAGFFVLAAADGSEALALSRSFPAYIDALVTDVEMPGIDGVTLAEQIMRERTETLVLVISAGSTKVIPGTLAFLAKPFSPKELCAKLEEVFAKRPQ
jgi:DNA-binding response OmpR family regulator